MASFDGFDGPEPSGQRVFNTASYQHVTCYFNGPTVIELGTSSQQYGRSTRARNESPARPDSWGSSDTGATTIRPARRKAKYKSSGRRQSMLGRLMALMQRLRERAARKEAAEKEAAPEGPTSEQVARRRLPDGAYRR